MIDGLVVVGTDTGVGKTVVTAGLVGMIRKNGVDAKAIKPCQTGYPQDDDAKFIADACGSDAAAICLQRLNPPLAPEVAADQEGVSLSYMEIVEDCKQILTDVECGIIEGIGGLRVPLAEGKEVIDFVAEFDLPTIIVAHSGLGTLNHTALTVEALRNRDIIISGIILNKYNSTTIAERTNPAVIERMTNLPVWTLPPLDLATPTAAVDGMAKHCKCSLTDLKK